MQFVPFGMERRTKAELGTEIRGKSVEFVAAVFQLKVALALVTVLLCKRICLLSTASL